MALCSKTTQLRLLFLTPHQRQIIGPGFPTPFLPELPGFLHLCRRGFRLLILPQTRLSGSLQNFPNLLETTEINPCSLPLTTWVRTKYMDRKESLIVNYYQFLNPLQTTLSYREIHKKLQLRQPLCLLILCYCNLKRATNESFLRLLVYSRYMTTQFFVTGIGSTLFLQGLLFTGPVTQ